MTKQLLFVLPPALLILLACLLVFPAGSDAPHQAVTAAATSVPADNGQALFPSFDPAIVTAVTITTPQSAFDLRLDENSSVSVNGHRGDKDVFSTMLAHIAAMDFIATDPFTAPEAPLLTLRIHQHGKEFSAAFYADNANGAHTRIIAGREQSPIYGLMDGWRVGALMLACEGTRIQDESGREIPIE
ncbi:MAG: hypothetical protein IKU34_05745 [Clostridia bacterium]|nr:hypothetical protein [Clostridia bacterium]